MTTEHTMPERPSSLGARPLNHSLRRSSITGFSPSSKVTPVGTPDSGVSRDGSPPLELNTWPTSTDNHPAQKPSSGCCSCNNASAHNQSNDRSWDRFPIAIIGIGCRMPGKVTDTKSFESVMTEGRDVISNIPEDRWSVDAFHHPDQSQAGKHVNKKAGFIDGLHDFDNFYFNTSPREAAMMDPQHRHLLEVTQEALDDAGITPEVLPSNTGVFVGIGMMDHAFSLVCDPKMCNMYIHTGAAHSVAANRISYTYNLQGPSVAVDTACASSVTALHHACNALWGDECPTALVGGCNILLAPEVTVGFSALGVLSPEGRSCPFDASAQGYVRSEGYGVVLLKPLQQAIEDNDHIYCTVRATASAHNGRSLSITMPSASAQEQLMRSVYAASGIPIDSIDYVEAHGTGTPVGDPIEVEAIAKTFSKSRSTQLRIGSSKSNFGHMECAAGIVQLIKVALMLKNRVFYPTINFTKLNPKVDPEYMTNIAVQSKLEPYTESKKLTMAVNSFGFGGSLGHVVLEEFSNKPSLRVPGANWNFGHGETKGRKIVIPLSSKTEKGLKDTARKWLEYENEEDAANVVSWMASRRPHYSHRLAVMADSAQDFREKMHMIIDGRSSDEIITGKPVNTDDTEICFVFPGQGQQSFDMGRGLYSTEYVYKNVIDDCNDVFFQLTGKSFIEQTKMFKVIDEDDDVDPSVINDVEVSQPAILFNQIGLIELIASWGVKPHTVVGHSLGEVAAAYACGALTLEEAVTVIYHRSTEQKKLTGSGSMAAMRCSEEEGRKLCSQYEDLHIACMNAPEGITIAGNKAAVESICESQPGKAKQLRVNCAFHTPHMEPLKDSFLKAMEGKLFGNDRRELPYFSTVTGNKFTGNLDADYWWQNIREPVRFEDAIKSLCRDHPETMFIEIGAAVTLLSSVRQTLKQLGVTPAGVLASGQRNGDHRKNILMLASNLHISGISVNWDGLLHCTGTWTQLPTYAWQHQHLLAEAEEFSKRRLGLQEKTFVGQNGVLSLDVFPFLKDHMVEDHIVFPAAGYIEYMIQSEFKEQDIPCLNNLSFSKVLTLPEEGDPVKLLVARDGKMCKLTSNGMEHAAGEIKQTPVDTKASKVDMDSMMKRLSQKKVPVEDLYQRFADIGLKYGDNFQMIKQIFIGDGEALGIMHKATDGKQRIQVAHLDAAFQILLSPLVQGTYLYLPRNIAKLKMFQPQVACNEDLWVHGKLVSAENSKITGDISICDANGTVMLNITGFEATKISIDDYQPDIDTCLYTTVLQPVQAMLPDTFLWKNEFTQSALSNAFPLEMVAIEKAEAYLPVIHEVSVSYAKHALESVPEKERYAGYARYVKRLKMMVDESTSFLKFEEIPAVLQKIVEDVPEFMFEVGMLRRLGEALPSTLREPRSTVQMLFGYDCIPQYFIDALSTRFYYKAVSAVVKKATQQALQQKKMLRILEVGSRMGGMTKYLLDSMYDEVENGQIEFFYTDVNTTFFAHGKQYLEGYPDIKYQQLDIEKDLKEQGFVLDTFDLIICLDTLHSVKEIQVGLKAMKDLLCPDGWLVMLEPTCAHGLPEIIFGALELCWVYEDEREHSCWMGRDGWLKSFKDGGLRDVVSVSTPNEFFHSVFVGRKPAASESIILEERKSHWLVVSSESIQTIVAEELLQKLKLNNDNSAAQIRSSCQQEPELETLEDGDCIIYICDKEDKNLSELLQLLQNCSKTLKNLNVWVAILNCTGTSMPVGFCRVAANEFSSINVCSISVSSTKNAAADIIRCIATQPKYAREVVVKEAESCIPMIMNFSAAELKSLPCKMWCMESDKVSNALSFRPMKKQCIGADEVRISVKAAGVNFKDVLQSMGMLYGYDAGHLGLEASGIVEEIGSEVDDLNIGDEVIAFGEDMFATHATCKANHVVRKPRNLNWEEAAGCGIVFATAYHALIERARLQAGETVLIHSACGGVGQAAIKIAQHIGAKVICTAGTEDKRQYLTDVCGIELVSDSRSDAFCKDVMKWTGDKGVHVVLNSLSGHLLEASINCLGHGGRFCEIGKRDILSNSNLDMGQLLENMSFLSVHIDILMKRSPQQYKQLITKVAELLGNQHIQPVQTKPFCISNVEGAFKHMKTGKHIGKIVLTVPDDYKPENLGQPKHLFHNDATYIITGGLGGIGQELSKWMAKCGARHLALVSRRGATNFFQRATLDSLEKCGVSVQVIKADICHESQVKHVFEELKTRGAPAVRGIFHLAALIDDDPITSMSEARLTNTINTKAMSAQHLHKITMEMGLVLDHFVLFSSASASWGNPDQAAYCAANLSLDQLAEERRHDGLQALSLQLGVVRGAGFLEDKPKVARIMKSKGFNALHISHYLRVMEKLLSSDGVPPVLCITDQDWSASLGFCHKDSMRFRHLVQGVKVNKGDTSLTVDELQHYVVSKLSDILGTDSQNIDVGQPMIQYGVDSMIAVEMVNWLNKEFDVNISQLDILGGITTATLVEKALAGEVSMPLGN